MDRGGWAAVRGAAESDTTEQLTDTHNSATNIHTRTHTHTQNSMDKGVWQATVYGVTRSWTRLSD